MKDAIQSPDAPAAIGPYSQAIRSGAWLFVSGQIPLDPATGTVVPGGIAEQTDRVCENVQAIVRAAGGTLAAVVKTTVYLVSLDDFGEMNAVYGRYFPAPAPARATVQAARLPRDVRIEIDAIAHLG